MSDGLAEPHQRVVGAPAGALLIDDLTLSPEVARALARSGVRRWRDLHGWSFAQLALVPDIGVLSAADLLLRRDGYPRPAAVVTPDRIQGHPRLDSRVVRVLTRLGFTHLWQLAALTPADLQSLPHIGVTAAAQIHAEITKPVAAQPYATYLPPSTVAWTLVADVPLRSALPTLDADVERQLRDAGITTLGALLHADPVALAARAPAVANAPDLIDALTKLDLDALADRREAVSGTVGDTLDLAPEVRQQLAPITLAHAFPELPTRVRAPLRRVGITLLGELFACPRDELATIPGLGLVALETLERRIACDLALGAARILRAEAVRQGLWDDPADAPALTDAIDAALKPLPTLTVQVLRARYGLDGAAPLALQLLMTRFGLTRDQIEGHYRRLWQRDHAYDDSPLMPLIARLTAAVRAAGGQIGIPTALAALVSPDIPLARRQLRLVVDCCSSLQWRAQTISRVMQKARV